MDFPGIFNEEGNRICYLDSASTTQKHRSFLESIVKASSFEYANIDRGFCNRALIMSSKYESCRKKVANLINANENEIVLTSSTTDSINMVANSFAYKFVPKGKKYICISCLEHHSNIIPWINLASRTGLEIKYIPVDSSGRIDIDQFENMLSEEIFLISVSHVSNVLGIINPIVDMNRAAKKYDILFFVDAAQSVAHLPIDVKNMDIDFLAFSAHKMYGPSGLGFLYGKYDLLEKMPPVKFGGGMIAAFDNNEFIAFDPPRKFEAGTPPIIEAASFVDVLDWFSSCNYDDILNNEIILYEYLVSNLQAFDVNILCKDESFSIISFDFNNGIETTDIVHFLGLDDVCVRAGDMCAKGAMKFLKKSSVLRVSFGIYNTREDIDRFLNVLESTVKLLCH